MKENWTRFHFIFGALALFPLALLVGAKKALPAIGAIIMTCFLTWTKIIKKKKKSGSSTSLMCMYLEVETKIQYPHVLMPPTIRAQGSTHTCTFFYTTSLPVGTMLHTHLNTHQEPAGPRPLFFYCISFPFDDQFVFGCRGRCVKWMSCQENNEGAIIVSGKFVDS